MIVCHYEYEKKDGKTGSSTVMNLGDGLSDAIKILLDYDTVKISIEKYNTESKTTEKENGLVRRKHA